MKNLPPLNALRSFCAVGQFRTIAGAAEELGVSASAVSQQIKSLESWSGVQLLARGKSSIELTQKGAAYYAEIWQALSMIEGATNILRGTETATRLTISVLPSFASQWLAPRLSHFRASHPDIDVSMLTTNELVDFSKSDVDIALRYGGGIYPNLSSRRIMSEAVNVVCTPDAVAAYEAEFGSTENLAGLEHVHFIDDVGSEVSFKQHVADWFRLNGLNEKKLNYAYRFTDSHIAVETVISENMYMLARLSLVEKRLKNGQIVAPFGTWTRENAAYYVVHPEHLPMRQATKRFVQWLARECSAWEQENIPSQASLC